MKLISQLLLFFLVYQLAGQSSDPTPYIIGEKHTIHSNILKEKREILIHVPAGFWGLDELQTTYPVAFVLDGESQFLQTVTAFDYLSSAPLGNDQMPRTIVVGIPNTNRNRDLTPTKGMIGNDPATLEMTGGGKAFLKFITDEVTTYVDSLYSLSGHRTIIGHSMGGLIVLEALLNRRDFFDNYLAIDPFLAFDEGSYLAPVMDTLRTVDLSGENLFVATASTLPAFLQTTDLEADTSDLMKLIKHNIKFRNLAESENWKLSYSTKNYPDDTHFSVPYRATPDALNFFYSYYPFSEIMDYYHPAYAEKTDLVARLKKHYQLISNRLGYPVHPMESYLNSWAYGFNHFKRRDLCMDLFDYNISLYPDRASVYNSKAYFLLNEGNNPEAKVLFEKSLKIKQDKEILETLKLLSDAIDSGQ